MSAETTGDTSGGTRVRRRVIVAGRVQGVWFRVAAREKALENGVCGWIRNLPDGRVEFEAEGSPSAVESMVAWAAHGPPSARVDSLESFVEKPLGATGFEVR